MNKKTKVETLTNNYAITDTNTKHQDKYQNTPIK